MSTWQPIETAPKDGSWFIAGINPLRVDANVWVAMCKFDGERFDIEELYPKQPDFWMPIPSFPKK
jgi:hypothetical protein